MSDENRSLVERLNSAHKLAAKRSSGEEGYAEREYVQNAIKDALRSLAHYEKKVAFNEVKIAHLEKRATHLRERLAERASESLDDEEKIEMAEIKIKTLEENGEVRKHLRGFIIQALFVSTPVMEVFDKCNLWVEKEVHPQFVAETKLWLIAHISRLNGKAIMGNQKFTKAQESIDVD